MSSRKTSRDGVENKISGIPKIATTKKETSGVDNTWIVTKGLEQVIEELVPEAVDVLMARQASPVLVTGPSGVGKTHVTNKIVEGAQISKDRVKRVNCAVFSEQIIELELFGHKKGSFTGAIANGTGVLTDPHYDLFVLEELGTLPKHLQAKLLVFLETGEYRRVGDNNVETLQQVPKIIGVTNSPPDSQTFREDFLFRFHIITIPGLHLRRYDIPELLQALLPGFTWSTLEIIRLMCYNWPGNMRQMRRFLDLVKRYRKQITNSSMSVLEWFDKRFLKVFGTFTRGPGTPGVPHMRGLWFFSLFQAINLPIWKELGETLPEFNLLPPKDNQHNKTPFDSKDLEESWHRWCYIVGQDEFADTDLWDRIALHRATDLADPREGHWLPDEHRDKHIDDLADRFRSLWYLDSFSSDQSHTETCHEDCPIKKALSHWLPEPVQEKSLVIDIDKALGIVLEAYDPRKYKSIWENHCSGMSSKEVATKYNLKSKSVATARCRWKTKQK